MNRGNVAHKLASMGFNKSQGRDYILDALEIMEEESSPRYSPKLLKIYSKIAKKRYFSPDTIRRKVSKSISEAWKNGLYDYFEVLPETKLFLIAVFNSIDISVK